MSLGDTVNGVLPLGASWAAIAATGGPTGFIADDGSAPYQLYTPQDVHAAAILHDYVPSNPADPSVPADNQLYAFARAMGLMSHGGVNVLGTSDEKANSGLWFLYNIRTGASSGGWLNTADANKLGASDSAWYSINYAEMRKAFNIFAVYGPLWEDNDRTANFSYKDWDAKDNITIERHVYFYRTTFANNSTDVWIDACDRCVQISGYSKAQGKWILPRPNGQDAPVWFDRKADGWKAFWSYDRWLLDSKMDIAKAAVWIGTTLLTVVTLGAGAPIQASLVAGITALANSMLAVMVASMNGSAGDVIAAVVDMAQKFAAVGGFAGAKAAIASNPSLAKAVNALSNFANSIATPFAQVYAASDKTISGLLSSAKALSKQFPAIDSSYFATLRSACGNSPFVGYCESAVSMTDLQALGNLLPSYAMGFAALGGTARAAQIAEEERFAGYGVQAMQTFDPSTVQVSILHPPPSAKAGSPLGPWLPKNTHKGDPQLGGGSGGGAIVVAAGVGLAWWAGFLKFLL